MQYEEEPWVFFPAVLMAMWSGVNYSSILLHFPLFPLDHCHLIDSETWGRTLSLSLRSAATAGP